MACSRDVPTKRSEIPPASNSTAARQTLSASNLAAAWDTSAGAVFILAADSAHAYVIDPAMTEHQKLGSKGAQAGNLVGAEFEPVNPLGNRSRVRIDSLPEDASGRCARWPSAHIVSSVPMADGAWDVAFPTSRVDGISFDSLAVLNHADSTRLTMQIARLASAAPGDTASAFRGRPYVVRQAHRFTLPDARRVVIAEVTRVINQEANPLQEELVLVGETPTSDAAAAFSLAYLDRQIGLEEAVESFDMLAALRVRGSVPAILLRREVGDGFRLVLLEREGAGTWRVRWRSAYAGC